ncbi:MAG: replication initiation protein RepC [Hyphomicrobiales bacterium]|nr:replication initiation protein RepC [Hyphomicrobiales bacterium]MDE2017496.1 replication initiation protein RepC [Hyphomicrobiales bacterium]
MSFDAIGTSAFGRRRVTRAQISAQIAVKAARADAARDARTPGRAGDAPGTVDKWALSRTLAEIRDLVGVSDRALGVLDALLSFHPQTALSLAPDLRRPAAGGATANGQGGDREAEDDGEGESDLAELVVFPSNRALCLRANGMSEATLRRHLAALVEAGLVIRRDSPNGKRYVRRGGGEGGTQAFGFDLSPLVARADEFAGLVATRRAERRHEKRLRERINLMRRDLAKRIAHGLDEALPGPWETLRRAFLDLCTPLRRLASLTAMEALNDALASLGEAVGQALESAYSSVVSEQPTGNADQNERHRSDSNPDLPNEFEPAFNQAGPTVEPETDPEAPAAEGGGARNGNSTDGSGQDAVHPGKDLPLAVVLDACPDILDYAFGGDKPRSWPAFAALAREVRPMLGISPDAWRCAVTAMGERDAAVALAFILQRCEHSSEARRHVSPADGKVTISVNGSPAIRSPGGYLRALTEKAGQDATGAPFPLWPAILAHLAQRLKARGGQG